MIRPIIKSIFTLSTLMLILSPAMTHAADGAELYKTKTCTACHGKDAKTPLMPNYPKIAGQNAAYALQQMKDIKSGARSNGQSAAMKGIMHLVTDEEMQVLADYVATLTP
jgi:cytochrome c